MTFTHLSDSRPKARKHYVCALCGTAIEAGAIHIARRAIGEDGPVTSRMHLYCESRTHDWDAMDWETGTDTAAFYQYEIAECGITDLNRSDK